MIKILLVDDETWIRTSVKNKIEWSEELTLCGEASDGFEALNLAVTLRPDLVITDVRMPGLSGIEMLEKMRVFLPDIQAIFISGYSEFEYVKSAIELNASGYVLKPIRKEELNTILLRTVEKIRQNNLLHKTTQTRLTLLHQFLRNFYNQLPVSLETFSEVLSDLRFYKEYQYILLLRIPETGEDAVALEQKLGAATASLSSPYVCTVFFAARNIFGIFLTSKEQVLILSYARNLIRKLQKNASLDVSIALGTPAHSVKQLPESFRSARNGLSLMHLYGCHEIILPNQDSREESKISLPKSIQRELLDGIYAHSLTDVNLALEKLRGFLTEENSLTVFEISRSLHLLMGNILQLLLEQNISGELADKGIALMQAFSSYQPSDKILDRFCDYCRETTLLPGYTGSMAATILKAEQYLADHYNEEITLKKMASLFYLNASYFSVAFKQVTGKNFNEYLTELRIENAKRYLERKNLKIHQVARLVGYEDCSYFGKIFRKSTGMTPQEYQRSVR